MSHRTLRSAIALLLVAGGAIFVLATRSFGLLSAGSAGYTYVADLDYWQRTPRERLARARYALDLEHDLSDVPLTIGDWQGEDVPQSNEGVFMILEPEQYDERLYRNSAGQYLWLTLIGGRSSRTFHPPESCYESYGWQTELTSHGITLENGDTLYGMLLDARKDGAEQVAFYVYLFPGRSRDPRDGLVIYRLTSPLYGSVEQTMAVQQEFLRHFFTGAQPTGGV
jgi:hypothetical protein